jgi:hypothetical protein
MTPSIKKSTFVCLISALAIVGCAKEKGHVDDAPAVYRTHEHSRAESREDGRGARENTRGNARENSRDEDVRNGRHEPRRDAHVGSESHMLSLKHISDDEVTLQSDQPELNNLQLLADTQGCFTNPAAGDLKNIRVCQTAAQISVHADKISTQSELHLVASRSQEKSASGLGLEKPRDFTLPELRKLVQSHSFKTREEFQKLLSAKANMRLHYLNLLPHLSFNSILSSATGGPLGLVASIGDLAPFLLPNRWAGAKENDRLYQAEKYSAKIVTEDAVNVVENLALAVDRDQKTLQELIKIRATVPPILDLINSLEAKTPPLLVPGRHRVVESPLNLLDETIVSLEDVVDTDLAELATAMGFENPLAIRSLDIGNFADILNPATFDFADLEKATIQTSNEIPQIGELIKAATANLHGRAFEWLDPSGDPQAGLGFGLPSHIEIEQHAVSQLGVAREKTRAVLLKKVRSAFVDLRMDVEQYKLSQQGIAIQSGRINADTEELKSAPNDTPIGDLQDSLEKLPTQTVSLLTAQYGWYMALSRVHRLTHTGPYSNFSN